MKEEKPVVIDAVYFVESEKPHNVIAVRPHLSHDSVWWEDTSRGTEVRYTKLKVDGKDFTGVLSTTPNLLEMVLDDGSTCQLSKLTQKLFNEKVKYHVAGGETMIHNSDEDLQNYYLHTNFYLY